MEEKTKSVLLDYPDSVNKSVIVTTSIHFYFFLF